MYINISFFIFFIEGVFGCVVSIVRERLYWGGKYVESTYCTFDHATLSRRSYYLRDLISRQLFFGRIFKKRAILVLSYYIFIFIPDVDVIIVPPSRSFFLDVGTSSRHFNHTIVFSI